VRKKRTKANVCLRERKKGGKKAARKASADRRSALRGGTVVEGRKGVLYDGARTPDDEKKKDLTGPEKRRGRGLFDERKPLISQGPKKGKKKTKKKNNKSGVLTIGGGYVLGAEGGKMIRYSHLLKVGVRRWNVEILLLKKHPRDKACPQTQKKVGFILTRQEARKTEGLRIGKTP